MEARDVKIYVDKIANQKERFYTLCNCELNIIDISMFLDDEEENFTKVYGVFEGNIIAEYNVVLTYNSMRNNKNYMIISDGKKINNMLAIYGLIYDEDLPQPFVEFIKLEEEIVDIYKIMDSIFLKNY